MWRPAYKQRCVSCKKNMVLIRSPRQRAICSQCQMSSFSEPITDPKFIELFNIDPALYEKSSFLRDIRYQYGRFGNLSEKQITIFKKVVKELTNPPTDPNSKGGSPQAPVRKGRAVKDFNPFSTSYQAPVMLSPAPEQPEEPILIKASKGKAKKPAPKKKTAR